MKRHSAKKRGSNKTAQKNKREREREKQKIVRSEKVKRLKSVTTKKSEKKKRRKSNGRGRDSERREGGRSEKKGSRLPIEEQFGFAGTLKRREGESDKRGHVKRSRYGAHTCAWMFERGRRAGRRWEKRALGVEVERGGACVCVERERRHTRVWRERAFSVKAAVKPAVSTNVRNIYLHELNPAYTL